MISAAAIATIGHRTLRILAVRGCAAFTGVVSRFAAPSATPTSCGAVAVAAMGVLSARLPRQTSGAEAGTDTREVRDSADVSTDRSGVNVFPRVVPFFQEPDIRSTVPMTLPLWAAFPPARTSWLESEQSLFTMARWRRFNTCSGRVEKLRKVQTR
jgi:hypothetical protein